MNKIELKKKKKFLWSVYVSNNVMTRKLFFRGASQEDILGLAISLIFDQFSIL